MLTKRDLNDDACWHLMDVERAMNDNATDGTTREVIVSPSTGETITVTLPWAATLVVKPSFGRHQAQWVAQRLLAKSAAPTEPELRRRRARAKPQSPQRWVLPTYDGDRPADLTDQEYRQEIERSEMFALLGTYDDIWYAIRHRGAGRVADGQYEYMIRSTHQALHRALVGGPVVDALGNECKWCREATR